jgi:hypothetical protein
LSNHIISTFSYPLEEIETVQEAKRLAKLDNSSLSQYILRLIKQDIHQKRIAGAPNSIGISYNAVPENDTIEASKPIVELNLDNWIEHISQVEDHQQLNIIKGIGVSIAKKADTRSMELYRKGIKPATLTGRWKA